MHLIPSGDARATDPINANVFGNLDLAISEGGENFSAGYAFIALHLDRKLTHIIGRNNCFAWLGLS